MFGWNSRKRFFQKAAVAGAAGIGAFLGGGTSAASAAGQARPAEQAVTTLKFQSTFPTTDIFHETLLDWGKKVEAMAGPRLKIDILPSGAVVGAFQLIDAVNDGILDGGLGVPAYWFGKNKGASLFGTGPSFGMDAEMLLGWFHYGGGADLYRELIQNVLKLDVHSFMFGPMPTQPLGWFKNEITGPADFQGQKFRTVGMSIDVFTELGAAVVATPGGEVVPALERGLLDSAEFNNPTSDKLLGFADVRKILMVQSFHQPVECLEILINKTRFNSLPKDIQSIMQYAAMAQSSDFSWKMMDRNSNDLIELKEKAGVQVIRTPRTVLEAQLQAWDKIVGAQSADPFFAKVVDSQRKWAGRVVPLRQEIMVDNSIAYEFYFKK